ncbi:TRAP transporter substrate-binding protein [Paracoccus sp. (in: a-proteobacteria)]|uniref:TRAP transporter substrate-binding protein n=1 Tax=Paracoccus sp. TaxID=267 RepID=UPI0035B15F53
MAQYKTFAVVGLMAMTAGSVVQAETVLKLATAAPENTPWGAQVNRLVKAVTEESEGRLKVEPYFNSQLGIENDTLAQLARGRIEMGLFTVNAAAQQAPEIGLMQLSGIYDSNDQRACVQDKYLTDEIRERLGSKGVYFGGWGEIGNGWLVSDRPLTNPDALKGLKIGISVNKNNTAYWRLLDANAVPVSPGEAASALSTGLVDVYPTVYSFYVPSGLNKIAPVLTEYNYTNGPGMWAVSQRVMDRMSEEDQEALKRAFGRFTSKGMMDEVFAFEDKLRQMHIDGGGEVVTPTDDEIARFREILPSFWAEMTAEYGADGEEIMALIEEGKANCAP